jgi:hypothetical protein
VPWAHVNFSERMGSRYVNPLRPGAMTPYDDRVRPLIGDIRFESGGRDLGGVLHDVVDVVVGAFDPPTIPVPAPWNDIRLTPALVRWRLLGSGEPNTEWHTAFDARYALPPTPFDDVYAPGTRQNRDHGPGWYRFYLLRHWNTASLRDGPHVVEVSAVDIRGNEAVEITRFVVANA